MPEQNFEQQARNMAEGFSIEPDAAVWQRVEKAIAEKKRKKWVLFWWLLPLMMAGGTAFLLFVGNKKPTQNIVHLFVKKDEKKESKKKMPLSDPNNKLLPKQREKITYHRDKVKKATVLSFQKTKTNEIKKDDESAAINNEKQPTSDQFFKEKKEPFISNDSNMNSLLQTTNGISKKSSDSTITTGKAEAVTSDSSVQKKDTATQLAKLKKQKNKPWHWGIVSETGLTSWGNKPFESGAAPSASPTIPPGNFDNINNGINTGGISVANRQAVKADAYFLIGAALQKPISKKMLLGAAFAYRYQPLRVTEIIRKDTTINPSQNNTSNFIYYTLNETQRFHFLNVNANISWQLLQGRKNTISLEAGFDNSFLMAMMSKNQSSAPQPDSLKINSTAKNFYRWQPSLSAAVDINFYTGKTSFLQLSPLVHFGLRKFQKNSVAYKENHLTSAGIRLIYFFK